jgi:predicted DNA-binding transcriptional regulator YafY
MSIYSPTTRLLTVLEMLQSRKQMSGSEIARRLEVDLRTVRRYIVMLQDMGIPVETERGPYGGYQLQRGYKLPPLMYTDSEAIALTLGLLAIRAFHLPVDVAAVEGALAKTERVMPEKLLKQVRGLQETLSFNVTPAPTKLRNEWVTMLTLAAQEGQRVWMQYEAWNGEISEREFDPYGVVYNEGWWYTTGYCHLRRGLRTFRLDRITVLELRDGTFERPTDFDALEHVLSSLATMSGAYQVEVLLKTTLEHARKVIVPPAGYVKETERGVIFYRESGNLEWIAHYLFYLDFPVVVLQPVELRERLREIGKRAFAMIEEPVDQSVD